MRRSLPLLRGEGWGEDGFRLAENFDVAMPALAAAPRDGPRQPRTHRPPRLPRQNPPHHRRTRRRPPRLPRRPPRRTGDRAFTPRLPVAQRAAGARSRSDRSVDRLARRNLGTTLGRIALRARPARRAARLAARKGQRQARIRRRVPRLRRRCRFPLRVPRLDGRSGHRRRTHRVRRRSAGHRLVDSGRRMEPLRVPLSAHAAAGSLASAYTDDGAHRPGPAHRLPRSRAGRLRLDVAAPHRGPALPRLALACFGRLESEARGALPHALAHAADRRSRRRAGRVQPHPQPQRTQLRSAT